MSGILSKLFTGGQGSSASSSSAAGGLAVPDVASIEALCKAINDLTTESADSIGQKAAELTRKNKEIFEKKTPELEDFLLHCNPAVGSAAMMAAIKVMFDISFHKNYEPGTDRAVELLKHYLDGGQLVAEHLRHVPEIVFPLVRNIALYCMNIKKKPEIGEAIVISALTQIFHDSSESPKKNYVTSCHSALFLCALQTGNHRQAVPFIQEYVDEIYNEHLTEEPANDENSAQSSSETAMNAKPTRNIEKDPGPVNIQRTKGKVLERFQNASPAAQAQINYIAPKFIFQYLYYGALILIEVEEYHRALILLETCVTCPAYLVNELQIESYKKFILVSLLIDGRASDIQDKSAAISRVAKQRMNEYKSFLNLRFKRGNNTHGEVLKLMDEHRDKLEKDGNMELVQKIIQEMRRKAILAVAKIYSSVNLKDVKMLANLQSDDEAKILIDDLRRAGRIDVRFDEQANSVIWEEFVADITERKILEAKKIIDNLRQKLTSHENILKKNPSVTARSSKSSVLMNEDEGLSMHPFPT